MFAGPAADPKSRIAALKLPKGGELTRKEIDDYTALVGRHGAKGLAYIKVNERAKGRDGLQSPILKFLPDAAIEGVLERAGAVDGDLVFFGADKAGVVNESLNALRLALGRDRKLTAKAIGRRSGSSTSRCSRRCPAAAGRRCIIRSRRRATASSRRQLRAAPGEAIARAYDIVLNGYEIGGGSIRIHDPELQSAMFDLIGITQGGGRAEVRLLADGARLRLPAARRHRVRRRPARDADGGRGQHPRRHRVPEDGDRERSHDGRAEPRGCRAAEGARHPLEERRRRADERMAAVAEFKRPESVLVVVHTPTLDCLLLERVEPRGFWQSVTGSLRWAETPAECAARELAEETGLAPRACAMRSVQRSFPILPGVALALCARTSRRNLEHQWYLEVPEVRAVRIEPAEHVAYRWLPVDARDREGRVVDESRSAAAAQGFAARVISVVTVHGCGCAAPRWRVLRRRLEPTASTFHDFTLSVGRGLARRERRARSRQFIDARARRHRAPRRPQPRRRVGLRDARDGLPARARPRRVSRLAVQGQPHRGARRAAGPAARA